MKAAPGKVILKQTNNEQATESGIILSSQQDTKRIRQILEVVDSDLSYLEPGDKVVAEWREGHLFSFEGTDYASVEEIYAIL